MEKKNAVFPALSSHLHYLFRRQAAFGRAAVKILRLFPPLSTHLHYLCTQRHKHFSYEERKYI